MMCDAPLAPVAPAVVVDVEVPVVEVPVRVVPVLVVVEVLADEVGPARGAVVRERQERRNGLNMQHCLHGPGTAGTSTSCGYEAGGA